MSDAALSVAPTHQAVPKVVWVSIVMMVVQVPIGLIYAFFLQHAEMGFYELVASLVGVVVSLGLIALLAFGYGWVRHLFLVGAILNIPNLVLSLAQLFHSWPLNGILVLGMHLWFLAALALLYSPTARSWFRDARMRRQRGL
jgi:hypothetical protein